MIADRSPNIVSDERAQNTQNPNEIENTFRAKRQLLQLS
jgi:hypothetical protein